MVVEIVKTKDVKTPTYATDGSAGMDFYLPEPYGYDLKPGLNKINLGIKMAIPEGYVLILKEKSGLTEKHEMMKLAGVIDCVPKDTMITTIEGKKSIEELLKQDSLEKIYSFNTDLQEFEIDEIDEIWEVGEKELLEIRFDDGSLLKCTPEHLILTNNGWVAAEDLSDCEDVFTE